MVETSVGSWWYAFARDPSSEINEKRNPVCDSRAMDIAMLPGGARAQCRFSGPTAKPIFRSPPLDGSPAVNPVPMERVGEGNGGTEIRRRSRSRSRSVQIDIDQCFVGERNRGVPRDGEKRSVAKGRRCEEGWETRVASNDGFVEGRWTFDFDQWRWKKSEVSMSTGGSDGARGRTRLSEADLGAKMATKHDMNEFRRESIREAEGGRKYSRRSYKMVSHGRNDGFASVGGFSNLKQSLLLYVVYPLKHPVLYEHIMGGGQEQFRFDDRDCYLNLRRKSGFSRGVLLHGPPGSGKTYLARAVVEEAGGVHCENIDGASCVGSMSGELMLKRAFERAKERAPSIILLDEVDALAPNRSSGHASDVERQATVLLLSLLDDVRRSKANVAIIASTSYPEGVDAALRRPGRLDKELFVGAPGMLDRFEILSIAAMPMPLAADVNLRAISNKLHGFMAADVAAVAPHAAMRCISESLEVAEASGSLEDLLNTDSETLRGVLCVQNRHLEAAVLAMKPSILRNFVKLETPCGMDWMDIGGLDHVKEELREAIEWPLVHGERLQRLGYPLDAFATGVLLYGPSGCGKTSLAKAVAGSCQCNFVSVNGPELLQKWLGESERALRDVFAMARSAAPCVLFFDEIDAIAHRREANDSGEFGSSSPSSGDSHASARMLTQLLCEMDGLNNVNGLSHGKGERLCAGENGAESTWDTEKYVIVIGATNRPAALDPALLRPGRLTRLIKVPLPDGAARHVILRNRLQRCPMNDDVDLRAIAESDCMEGMSGADVAEVARRAALKVVRASILNGDYSDSHDPAGAAGLLTNHTLRLNQDDVWESAQSVPRSVTIELQRYFDALEERIRAGKGLMASQNEIDIKRKRIAEERKQRFIKVAYESQLLRLQSRVDLLEEMLRSAGLEVPPQEVTMSED